MAHYCELMAHYWASWVTIGGILGNYWVTRWHYQVTAEHYGSQTCQALTGIAKSLLSIAGPKPDASIQRRAKTSLLSTAGPELDALT